MGLTIKWTQEEINYLKDNYANLSTATIAEELYKISYHKRSRKAIERYAMRIKVSKKSRWSNVELNYLTELIGEYPFEILVKKFQHWSEKQGLHIRRSPSQIKAKIKQQKQSIRVNASSKYLTKKDIKYLLGCDRTSINNLFNRYREELKPKADGGKEYVSRRRFKQFLLNHTSILIRYQTKLDIVWLADILNS